MCYNLITNNIGIHLKSCFIKTLTQNRLNIKHVEFQATKHIIYRYYVKVFRAMNLDQTIRPIIKRYKTNGKLILIAKMLFLYRFLNTGLISLKSVPRLSGPT